MLKSKRHGCAWKGIAVAATLVCALSANRLNGQLTDLADGRITSGNWLVLGPFANAYGCTTNGADLLQNFIAPSFIHCQYPTDGDTIEYDADLAASTAYGGPLQDGKPVWRVFDDGTNDGDIDLDLDGFGDLSDQMSWLVTYFEYSGTTPLEATLCAGSDDADQIWLDESLVLNNPACRGRGVCQDNPPVVITPGLHVIRLGIWERAGGWGGSCGIRVDGAPVIDDGSWPDFLFLGTDSSGLTKPCLPLPERKPSSPGNPNVCPPEGGGPISVKVTQAGGTAAEVVAVVEEVRGAFDKTKVTADNGGVVADLFPSLDLRRGFITSWLLLGPLSQPNGANPGDDIIRLDYLTDGATTELDVEPTAGDTIEPDYSGLAASTGLAYSSATVNPDGVPTWGEWYDGDDTINFDEYYGGNIDNIMMYAVTYVRVENDVDVTLCMGSDDAIQVFIDDVEVHINNAARPCGNANECQDSVNLVDQGFGTLEAGTHKILVKILEGGGGHCFRLGLLDSGTLQPAEGISVCLQPGAAPCVAPPVGAKVTWNVARSVLQGAGVGYQVNIAAGGASFRGNVAGTNTFGPGTFNLVVPPTKYGPFTDPDFTQAHNIGNPCPSTSITKLGPGALQIAGAGEDIWQNGDQFMFAYNSVAGDFSARVTITDRQYAPGSQWGKHGIMARQDCGVRSRYSFMHDNGENPIDASRFATRPTHGGNNNFEVTGPLPASSHYDNLRLDRCGDTFIGYILDLEGLVGVPGKWVEVGRATWADAPASVQLGLAVTSHQACDVTTITFEDWTVLPFCEGPVEGLTCTENDSGGLDLAWSHRPGADTSGNIEILVNGSLDQTIPGTATSATVASSKLPAGEISTVEVVNGSGISATCNFPPAYSSQGFIKDWLLLGPYKQPGILGLDAPGDANIRRDHLTNADGSVNELDVEPNAGDTVDTAYGPAGPARSIRIEPALGGNPNNINPGGVPTWFAWRDTDDTVAFEDYYGGDVNGVMMYAVTYIEVAEDIIVDIGLASDDAVQVLLDGEEIWINNVARGSGVNNQIQDTISSLSVFQLNPLTQGVHKLMVKVFEGGGGHNFRLRFQDPTTIEPVIVGKVLLQSGGGPTLPKFHRGDADDNGQLQLTDAVRILGFLFLGGAAPTCLDAGDADDNGQLQLTDAVRVLGFLFLGGPPPAAPGPPGNACGSDPTDTDALDCASYTKC